MDNIVGLIKLKNLLLILEEVYRFDGKSVNISEIPIKLCNGPSASTNGREVFIGTDAMEYSIVHEVGHLTRPTAMNYLILTSALNYLLNLQSSCSIFSDSNKKNLQEAYKKEGVLKYLFFSVKSAFYIQVLRYLFINNPSLIRRIKVPGLFFTSTIYGKEMVIILKKNKKINTLSIFVPLSEDVENFSPFFREQKSSKRKKKRKIKAGKFNHLDNTIVSKINKLHIGFIEQVIMKAMPSFSYILLDKEEEKVKQTIEHIVQELMTDTTNFLESPSLTSNEGDLINSIELVYEELYNSNHLFQPSYTKRRVRGLGIANEKFHYINHCYYPTVSLHKVPSTVKQLEQVLNLIGFNNSDMFVKKLSIIPMVLNLIEDRIIDSYSTCSKNPIMYNLLKEASLKIQEDWSGDFSDKKDFQYVLKKFLVDNILK